MRISGLLAAVACVGPAPGTAWAEVRLDVRARAVAPGEPVRLVADSDAPLAAARAEFLGQRVHLVPDAAPPARTWSGWALVPLGQAPGPAAVEFVGTDAEGRAVPATHAVAVEARDFPEERLSVSSRYVAPPPEVEARLARERERLAHLYERRTGTRTPGPFLRPVPGDATSVFGTRRLYNGEPRSPHPGLDLRASTGTPVRASGPGTVVLAADLYYSGNTVILDHGGGLFTVYAHLSDIAVTEGGAVEAGAILGRSGATGRVTGPHLHWGAKIGDLPFDPTALLDPALW